MRLTDGQIRNLRDQISLLGNSGAALHQRDIHGLLDTIADLKAELAAAQAKLSDLEGIDQACQFANEHVGKLMQLAQAQTRMVAEARLDEAEWWAKYGGQACTEGDFNDMWDRREALKARVAEAQKLK